MRAVPSTTGIADKQTRAVLEALAENIREITGGASFNSKTPTVQDLVDGGVIVVDRENIRPVKPDDAKERAQFEKWIGQDQASFRVTIASAKSADYTILANQSGTAFSNGGASGTITGSLPVAVVGAEFVFVRNAAHDHRADPNGTETIRGGGAGKYIELDADGESVTLKCFKLTEWEIIASEGELSFEA